jgi:hypothetical protein
MKLKLYVLAGVVAAITAACGSNSSDKETPTPIDTAVISTDTTVVSTMDTSKAIVVNVPEKTKTVFEKKYPKASNVKWEPIKAGTKDVDGDLADEPEVEEEGHRAFFHWQGNDRKEYYDDKSNWVATVDAISDPASLPKAVTNSIKKQFDGYTITAVNRENDRNRTAYKVTLEKGSERLKVTIDENGNVLKKKTVS